MKKTEQYRFEKQELYSIFEQRIGRKITRLRFSPRTQTIICEIDEEGKENGDL